MRINYREPFRNRKLDFETYAGVVQNTNKIIRTVGDTIPHNKFRFRFAKITDRDTTNNTYEAQEVTLVSGTWQSVGTGSFWWASNSDSWNSDTYKYFNDLIPLDTNQVYAVNDIVSVFADPHDRSIWYIGSSQANGYKIINIRSDDYPDLAFDPPSLMKSDAFFDYICDGTNDEEQIEQAIQEIQSSPFGGEINLYGGTFYIQDGIQETLYSDTAIIGKRSTIDLSPIIQVTPQIHVDTTDRVIYFIGNNEQYTPNIYLGTLDFYAEANTTSSPVSILQIAYADRVYLTGVNVKSQGLSFTDSPYIINYFNDCTITGCESNTNTTSHYAFDLQFGGDVTFSSCSVNGASGAFYCNLCDTVDISSLTLNSACTSPVIDVDTTKEINVVSTTIDGTTSTGMVLQPIHSVKIYDCDVVNSGAGIQINGSTTHKPYIEFFNCNCSANTGDGIDVNTGDRTVIKDCITNDNGGDGLTVQDFYKIDSHTANYNGEAGIYCEFNDGVGGTIYNCVANDNTSSGIILDGDGSVQLIGDCTSTGNGATGLLGATTTVVVGNILDCTITDNGAKGIGTCKISAITACNVSANTGIGVDGTVGMITGSTIDNNGGTDIASGYTLLHGVTYTTKDANVLNLSGGITGTSTFATDTSVSYTDGIVTGAV